MGADRLCLLRKIQMGLHGMKFFTSLTHFAPSFVRQPNSPKCTQIVENRPKHEFGSNGVDRVRSLRKIPMGLHGTKFFTSLTRFTLSVVTQPNSPKCTQIIQNTPKHEFRVQWGGSGCSLLKFQRDFMARTFAPVWPVLPEFF